MIALIFKVFCYTIEAISFGFFFNAKISAISNVFSFSTFLALNYFN